MKIVIVEDEKPAADHLEQMLKRYDPDIEILQRLDSVKASISWFQESGTDPDLVFMDIRLLQLSPCSFDTKVSKVFSS